MFKELNPLLHSELRLAVMSMLLSVEEAEFTYLKQETKATAGNLSVQIDKLSKAGYIEVTFHEYDVARCHHDDKQRTPSGCFCLWVV